MASSNALDPNRPVKGTLRVADETQKTPTPTAPTAQTQEVDPQWRARVTGSRRYEPTLDRSAKVMKALQADNRQLIADNPAGAKEKFDALAETPFRFFRGTGGLFYRDLEGLDIGKPEVTASGDVHPENFGIIEGADKKLYFGLNDFDESTKAPFTWDLRRGATAFELAAREHKDFTPEQRADVVGAFMKGYADGIGNAKTGVPGMTEDDAPKVVAKLFEKAEAKTRADFIGGLIDPNAEKFVASKEVKPEPKRVPEMTQALKKYLDAQGLPPDSVKDVAAKLDSGTASLGADRYYVLIHSDKGAEHDRVLEVKAERPSVLEPYTGKGPAGKPAAERVVAAQKTMSPDGDPYYGAIELNGKSFLVRERNPHKEGVKLDKLDADEMRHYAKACGEVLAAAHAHSGTIAGEPAARAIGKALDDKTQASIIAFATDEAARVTSDQQVLKAAMAAGTALPK